MVYRKYKMIDLTYKNLLKMFDNPVKEEENLISCNYLYGPNIIDWFILLHINS